MIPRRASLSPRRIGRIQGPWNRLPGRAGQLRIEPAGPFEVEAGAIVEPQAPVSHAPGEITKALPRGEGNRGPPSAPPPGGTATPPGAIGSVEPGPQALRP